MANDKIQVVWTVEKPKDEELQEVVLAACWFAALTFDKTCVAFNVRSLPHNWTTRDGKRQKDDMHITLSVKNPAQKHNGKHRTLHVDTSGNVAPFGVVKIKPSKRANKDTDLNNHGNPCWNHEHQPVEMRRGDLDDLVEDYDVDGL